MRTYLDFEKPIAELESKVAELKTLAAEQRSVSIEEELAKLENKAREALEETYSELTPWQKTQVARHPERPHFRHYIDTLVEDFTPLAGDRYFAEDQAIIGGIGRLAGRSVMVIGHEKGSDTEGRIKHNFGMARPEGYRKAVRLMEMADRFQLPVISLVDTAGAYPGIGAEERGQAEAIARSTDCCLGLGVPIVSVIIGEGGSGGAVAIATANRIYMLEHSIYTVASPEAAASILWRDSAARGRRRHQYEDHRPGPFAARHHRRDHPRADRRRASGRDRGGRAAGETIVQALASYDDLSPAEIRKERREKFLSMGRASLDAAAPKKAPSF